MASASASQPRRGQALADILAKPSRGYCCYGLLHRTDDYLPFASCIASLSLVTNRRKILRFNITRHPSALWIVQQMREAWPYAPAPKFLLFDHDSKFGNDVVCAAKTLGSEPLRIAFRSPWQNGVAERWVGSCRRDLLDHVIVLNERHLKRLMTEYVRYYHDDRTHLGLAKDTPVGRPPAIRSALGSKIHSLARLGGLHHRYAAAA
jgi:putative transposase